MCQIRDVQETAERYNQPIGIASQHVLLAVYEVEPKGSASNQKLGESGECEFNLSVLNEDGSCGLVYKSQVTVHEGGKRLFHICC